MVSTSAKSQMQTIIDKHGEIVTIYSPTKTLNDEGDATLTLGTGTEVKCLMFNIGPEEMQWKVEGLDTTDSYRCYFKYNQSINKDTIVEHDGKYYKIHSLGKVMVDNEDIYIVAVITRAELNI